MFGYHKAKREKKRAKKEKLAAQEAAAKLNRQRKEKNEFKDRQKQTNELADQYRQQENQARLEGKEYADELLSREYEGLTPQQRAGYQQSANAQINRDIQGYDKRLLAQQGRRGVRGGAAYAQRQDLARLGTDAQQQMQRDLSALDSELAIQKLKAAYGIEQNAVSDAILREQMARTVLDSYDQRKYQKALAEQANRLFWRI